MSYRSAGGAFNFSVSSGQLGWSRLCTGQVVDGQKADEYQPLSFNFFPPILFLPVHDDQSMSHNQACFPSSRDSLKKRAPACEHIIHNHGSIPWLKRSFDEFSEPMILRLLPHHEGPPCSLRLRHERKIRDAGGNGNRSDFQSAEAVEVDRSQ